MGPEARRPRLDEILRGLGLVTEEQVEEALLRQKAHGGKLGSQLLYCRFVDEAGLVQGLATQFGTEGVVLSNLLVEPDVLQMIPKKIAVARHILPFAFEAATRTLSVACEDPTDHGLLKELSFVATGKKVRLYVAAEMPLNVAIARFHLGREVTLEEHLRLALPDVTADPDAPAQADPEARNAAPPVILWVTAEVFAAPLLQSILEREGFVIRMAASMAEAMLRLEQEPLHTVLIHASGTKDSQDLVDRLRRISPRTRVRTYTDVSELLLGEASPAEARDVGLKSLELFTSLLASRSGHAGNHSGWVGRYTGELCVRLGLSDTDRMLITHAAYVHDLAQFYYGEEGQHDKRSVIQLTRKLLEAIDYPPVILEMLKSMYVEMPPVPSQRLTLEELGGSILTLVDLYCEAVPPSARLTLDRFDVIRRKLRSLAGKMVLADVVEAFVEMIQGELLNLQVLQRTGQVMLYAPSIDLIHPLALRLRNEGFRVVAETAKDELLELYTRSRPELLVMVIPGDAESVVGALEVLEAGGLEFRALPTILLAERPSVGELSGLLERGLEDVLPLEDNFDLLVTKLARLEAKRTTGPSQPGDPAQAAGARGRLADMNLIDLLQALGPSRRSVRIAARPGESADQELCIYLRSGDISFAACGDLKGPEAVYEAIGWSDGTWAITPVGEEEFPAANVQLPNDAILMEACRLADERTRSGRLL